MVFVTLVFLSVVSYVAFIVDNPTFDSDLLFYYYVGKEILYGNKENVQIFNAPVGWPILLASFDFLIDDPFITAKLFSVISASGIVFISYYIIRNVFGERVALLGQILIAITPFLHIEAILTHSEMLPVFLIFTSFYFITKKQLLSKHIVFCAILLGLSFMLRFQSLLIAAGVLIFLLFVMKQTGKHYVFYFILCFLLTISPLLIYNISISGNLIDADPNFYSATNSFSNNVEFEKVVSENTTKQFNLKQIELYVNNYFYNLFYYNSHIIFNLGHGFNNFAPLPFVPYIGILFILGGSLGIFNYKTKKIHLVGIFGISLMLLTFLLITNQLEYFFLSIVMIPVIILGILSLKKIESNALPLLIIPFCFILSISFVRIDGAWDMFSILIVPSALTAFFIINIIPKSFTKASKFFKINLNVLLKILLLSLICIMIISNLLFSYMVEKNLLYGVPVDYHNVLEQEKKYDLRALEYKEVGELLAKQPDIKNKYVMASDTTYAHYAKSKFLYTHFTEGIKNDTVNSFIARENWSNFQIKESNVSSIPTDRHNIYHPIPDYVVYKKTTNVAESIKVLENPQDLRIPKNFDLLYFSNTTGTIVYKINRSD